MDEEEYKGRQQLQERNFQLRNQLLANQARADMLRQSYQGSGTNQMQVINDNGSPQGVSGIVTQNAYSPTISKYVQKPDISPFLQGIENQYQDLDQSKSEYDNLFRNVKRINTDEPKVAAALEQYKLKPELMDNPYASKITKQMAERFRQDLGSNRSVIGAAKMNFEAREQFQADLNKAVDKGAKEGGITPDIAKDMLDAYDEKYSGKGGLGDGRNNIYNPYETGKPASYFDTQSYINEALKGYNISGKEVASASAGANGMYIVKYKGSDKEEYIPYQDVERHLKNALGTNEFYKSWTKQSAMLDARKTNPAQLRNMMLSEMRDQVKYITEFGQDKKDVNPNQPSTGGTMVMATDSMKERDKQQRLQEIGKSIQDLEAMSDDELKAKSADLLYGLQLQRDVSGGASKTAFYKSGQTRDADMSANAVAMQQADWGRQDAEKEALKTTIEQSTNNPNATNMVSSEFNIDDQFVEETTRFDNKGGTMATGNYVLKTPVTVGGKVYNPGEKLTKDQMFQAKVFLHNRAKAANTGNLVSWAESYAATNPDLKNFTNDFVKHSDNIPAFKNADPKTKLKMLSDAYNAKQKAMETVKFQVELPQNEEIRRIMNERWAGKEMTGLNGTKESTGGLINLARHYYNGKVMDTPQLMKELGYDDPKDAAQQKAFKESMWYTGNVKENPLFPAAQSFQFKKADGTMVNVFSEDNAAQLERGKAMTPAHYIAVTAANPNTYQKGQTFNYKGKAFYPVAVDLYQDEKGNVKPYPFAGGTLLKRETVLYESKTNIPQYFAKPTTTVDGKPDFEVTNVAGMAHDLLNQINREDINKNTTNNDKTAPDGGGVQKNAEVQTYKSK